jgi:RecG-like helicase
MMKTRRVDSKAIRLMMTNLVQHQNYLVPEIFSVEMCRKYKLISRSKAFRFIHQPPSHKHIEAAQYRFKFEELFFLQLPFINQKINRKEAVKGIHFMPKKSPFQKFCCQPPSLFSHRCPRASAPRNKNGSMLWPANEPTVTRRCRQWQNHSRFFKRNDGSR